MLGVLMLDSSPLDVPGCLACDDTFPFPLKREVVRGATVEKMTSCREELEEAITDAAQNLERQGVEAIIGNCGFMALFQTVLQQRVKIPVFTSSLLLVPMIAQTLPRGRRVGILTFRKNYLSEKVFRGAGWSSDEISIAVAGVQDQGAWQCLRTPEHPFHGKDLEEQLLYVGKEFVRTYPDLGALVLECTVMPPFAAKLQTEVKLPIYDITLMTSLVAESFSRQAFQRINI